MTGRQAPLVSVVIPCWNQARFLAAAIESVLAQSHTSVEVEIIVIDDGSTDEPGTAAAPYPDVRVVRQPNRGRSAARNAGARIARGQFLVFLDADDRLLPDALVTGARHLTRRPDCALVSGHRVLIDATGQRLQAPLPVCVAEPDYLSLLQSNFILTPAVAMFRRSAFLTAGGWDETLHASEDFELYLRLARRWSIDCHHTLVAEYRQHGANTSADAALMLRSTLAVVRLQREHAFARPGGARAYHAAIVGWWDFWARQLVQQIGRRVRGNPLQKRLYLDAWALVRHTVPVIAMRVRRKIVSLLSRRPAARERGAAAPDRLAPTRLDRGEHSRAPARAGVPSTDRND